MTTQKATIVSAILLVLILVLQLLRLCYPMEIEALDIQGYHAGMAIHITTAVLGIVIAAVWWIRFFVTGEQAYPMAQAPLYDPSQPMGVTICAEKTVQYDAAPKPVAVQQPPLTKTYVDTIRISITLSDGRTKKMIRMRVDCPQEARLTIGNSKNCGIWIQDATLSPRHAVLLICRGIVQLYNPGHNNGVRVGKNLLPEGKTVVLERGQSLVLGGVSLLLQ